MSQKLIPFPAFLLPADTARLAKAIRKIKPAPEEMSDMQVVVFHNIAADSLFVSQLKPINAQTPNEQHA